ncbi:hypothetical protein STVA_46320 [Allostella vacuolata]|nr:hypothetical protein STVA_46320 [Stella vacuolata]
MGQMLHGVSRTTEALRRAIKHSQESLRSLVRRHGINPETVPKWNARSTVADAKAGPKEPRSTVLSAEEEAVIVAFRRYTLLPLDDCLYALQPTIPHLTRPLLVVSHCVLGRRADPLPLEPRAHSIAARKPARWVT